MSRRMELFYIWGIGFGCGGLALCLLQLVVSQ